MARDSGTAYKTRRVVLSIGNRNFLSESEINRLAETLGSVARVIGGIILFPVRVLFLPFEALMRASGWGGDSEEVDESLSDIGVVPFVLRWIQKSLRWVFALPLLLLRSPFVVVQRLIAENKVDLLFVIPAIAMLAFLSFVFFQVWIGDSAITNRYRQGAYLAIQNRDFPLAKTYFTRMINDAELSPADQLKWASVLSQTGDDRQAIAVLNQLAPDDGVAGYPPAHRIKAIRIASSRGTSEDPARLKRLKRHLDCCQDESPEISRIWATYYLEIGDVDAAMARLSSASETNPEFLFLVADLSEKEGQFSRMDRTLKDARAEFQFRIEKDPLDTNSRISLAKVFTRLQRYNDAEQLLLTGLRLQPDAEMKRATASFYVMRHDTESKKTDGDFSRQFELLQKAIEADASFTETYDRLTALFLSESSVEQKEAIKSGLLEQVTGDSPSAMAHFALSNLFGAEGDDAKAEWHLEQAHRLDNEFVAVINNLAWLLAHKREPDLDRALELAEIAVSRVPGNAEFLDTLGSVLLLQNRHEQAIAIFEKALRNSRSKNEIHVKLAACYRAIGRTDLANLHARNAKKPAEN